MCDVYAIYTCTRRTKTCHMTHTHDALTRNQLYCRVYDDVCECAMCTHNMLHLCTPRGVPAGLAGNYLFTQIDHNYGYYRRGGTPARGHLTPSKPLHPVATANKEWAHRTRLSNRRGRRIIEPIPHYYIIRLQSNTIVVFFPRHFSALLVRRGSPIHIIILRAAVI